MSKILKDLHYTQTHEWIKVEGNHALIGITDYAQETLGSVVFVDLPSIGATFDQKEAFGAVESVKAASDLMMPVSGKIIEVNDTLQDQPELLNTDPYSNWIIKIELTDDSELKALLSDKEYEKSIH